MTTIDYGERFDAAIADSLDPFQPTAFGESLMWHIVKLVCMTAPRGELGIKAYAALEDHVMDDIVADIRTVVVRHVSEAVAA